MKAQKIAEIIDSVGVPQWEVWQESNGLLTVERDALNGSEDTTHATIAEVEQSIPEFWTLRLSQAEVKVNG